MNYLCVFSHKMWPLMLLVGNTMGEGLQGTCFLLSHRCPGCVSVSLETPEWLRMHRGPGPHCWCCMMRSRATQPVGITQNMSAELMPFRSYQVPKKWPAPGQAGYTFQFDQTQTWSPGRLLAITQTQCQCSYGLFNSFSLASYAQARSKTSRTPQPWNIPECQDISTLFSLYKTFWWLAINSHKPAPRKNSSPPLLTSTDVSVLHTGTWVSLGSKSCSILFWGNKIAIYIWKRKNALQSNTETRGYTSTVVAVIVASKVPSTRLRGLSPSLAAGGCTAAPGFLCCVAEGSHAAAGSTTRAVTAVPITA